MSEKSHKTDNESFGTNRASELTQSMADRRCSTVSVSVVEEELPKTTLITHDLIRDLYIPRDNPPLLAAVVTANKLSKIKANAKNVTKQEKEAAIQKQQEAREKLRKDAAVRRAEMQEKDLFRKQNTELNDLEEEAKQKMEYLREKANKQRQEQEEEIKEINEYILAAKVQAIRDIQTKEKIAIQQQHKQAELDLDEMMEKLRVEGLRQEEEKANERKKEAYEAADLLQEQIHQNFDNKTLEKEKKNQEGEAAKEKFEKMRLEDEENIRLNKIKQKNLLETLQRENAVILQQKQYKKMQSRQEDIMIAAYQRHKAELEEAAEAEKKEMIRKREIEIAKLREQQEKASDLQAEKDAIRARRAQEQKEREYRKNEKERILKNKIVQDDLCKNRIEQLETKNRIRFLQAERDAKEYAAENQRRIDDMETEVKMIKIKRLENLKYNEDLNKQIMKNEQEKIQKRREFFEEGENIRQEEKMRKLRVKALQNQKVDDLLKYDISDTYIAHVRRKFHLAQK